MGPETHAPEAPEPVRMERFAFYDRASVSAAREGQGRMLVSQIPGVEGAGSEFMRAVFDLSAGDVVARLNCDHVAPTASVVGRVVDATGAGVAGLCLRARGTDDARTAAASASATS